MRDALVQLGGVPTLRWSRPFRPSRSSTTATSSSTRSLPGRMGPCSASTAPALGRGARHPRVLADHRARQRPSRRCPFVGSRARAGAVRPGSATGFLRHLVVREGGTPGRRSPSSSRPRRSAGGVLRPHDDPLSPGEVRLLGRERPARRGHVRAVAAALGRGGDRGGALRPPLPGASECIPADEHCDGRADLRARRSSTQPYGGRDRLRPLLRYGHDRSRHGAKRDDGVGHGGVRGVRRLRDRERRAERDRQRGLLRRGGRPLARGAPRARGRA